MDAKTVREKHKQFLFPSVINYYQEPLVLERGEGTRVFDKDGRDYLDFFGGILTVSVGHCQPQITERVAAQLHKLQHVSTLYPCEPIVALAEKLAAITPGKLSRSFFTSSGTEADETAVMLARLHTGNHDLIALRHAYSGRSLLATNLTAHAAWRPLPSLVPGIKHAHNAYCYRCSMGLSYPACDLRCARDVEELIQTETCGQVAGMLAEPIQGVGGFIVPPPEYFPLVAGIIRDHGGVFIADEVQTGFGRTGGKMFGIEHWGVEPEIMTMAKGIANGLPLGATVATDEVADSFGKSLTISTFGGNPVSTTAALATIELIEQQDVVGRSAAIGQRLGDGLADLARQHPTVGEVRGMGLMQAIELVADPKTREPAPALAAELMERTRDRGLLIGKGGLYGNVMRIAPPMLVTAQEVDGALETIGRCLAQMQS
jgi:4-aminobutyrate aminotransferase-like enzyme